MLEVELFGALPRTCFGALDLGSAAGCDGKQQTRWAIGRGQSLGRAAASGRVRPADGRNSGRIEPLEDIVRVADDLPSATNRMTYQDTG
jgi:hypothetical protein